MQNKIRQNIKKKKGKNKKIYSMTDSEINDEDLGIGIDASFWNGPLSIANSLELTAVSPKSPEILRMMTPTSLDSMESPLRT